MDNERIAKELCRIADDIIMGKSDEPIFDPDDENDIKRDIEKEIEAPFVTTQMSSLGGKENASIIITVSLDPEREWENGILENSRFLRFHLERNGELENFTVGMGIDKMRKKNVKSIDDAIDKINRHIDKVS